METARPFSLVGVISPITNIITPSRVTIHGQRLIERNVAPLGQSLALLLQLRGRL